MAEDAKKYLHDKELPTLFEGLMTGLIHNKPEDPIDFMQSALRTARKEPVQWDTFVKTPPPGYSGPPAGPSGSGPSSSRRHGSMSRQRASGPGSRRTSQNGVEAVPVNGASQTSSQGTAADSSPPAVAAAGDDEDDDIVDTTAKKSKQRKGNKVAPLVNGATEKAEVGAAAAGSRPGSRHSAKKTATNGTAVATPPPVPKSDFPDIPIILFMGGPGIGKTRHAFRIAQEFAPNGLKHICAPDLIKAAITKRKDSDKKWADAAKKYEAGELISSDLAVSVVKDEMNAHKATTKAFFLEGFPRELQQVTDFEAQVKKINLALILDFDEETLRQQMKTRGLADHVIKQRLAEYKSKTLPAAKYFDDKLLLHLIPGEQEADDVLKQCGHLIKQSLGIGDASNAPKPKPKASVSKPPPGTAAAKANASSKTAAKSSTTSTGKTSSTSGKSTANSQSSNPAAKPTTMTRTNTSDTIVISSANNNPGTSATTMAPSASGASSRAESYKDPVPTGLPNDAPVIIIVGAPGAQKTEYCRRIVAKYDGFVHISMGDLLRQQLQGKPDDPKWKQLADNMNKGEFMPTRECRKLIYAQMHAHKKAWGYVVDGYPRTVDQAKDFEKTVDRIDLVILIDATEHFCMNKLKARLEGGSSRPDDKPEGAQQRLSLFKQETLHMLKYFEDKSKLKVVRAKPKVEGDKGLDEVFAAVVNVIDAALFIPENNGNGDGQSLESSKNSKEDAK